MLRNRIRTPLFSVLLCTALLSLGGCSDESHSDKELKRACMTAIDDFGRNTLPKRAIEKGWSGHDLQVLKEMWMDDTISAKDFRVGFSRYLREQGSTTNSEGTAKKIVVFGIKTIEVAMDKEGNRAAKCSFTKDGDGMVFYRLGIGRFDTDSVLNVVDIPVEKSSDAYLSKGR